MLVHLHCHYKSIHPSIHPSSTNCNYKSANVNVQVLELNAYLFIYSFFIQSSPKTPSYFFKYLYFLIQWIILLFSVFLYSVQATVVLQACPVGLLSANLCINYLITSQNEQTRNKLYSRGNLHFKILSNLASKVCF